MRKLLVVNDRGEALYKMNEIGFKWSAPSKSTKVESDKEPVDAVGFVIDGPLNYPLEHSNQFFRGGGNTIPLPNSPDSTYQHHTSVAPHRDP